MTGVPPSGSGHSPKSGAAISVPSPAKPSVPNAAHTPGPWKASEYPEGAIYEIDGPNGELIGGADFGDEPLVGPDRARANARLMTAAPELYEALAGLARNYGGNTTLWKAAAAALAKARGETL